MSRIFKRSGYLRVLFVGLPYGIGALIVGIPMFKDIPESNEYLSKHVGITYFFGDTIYYDKGIDLKRDEIYYLNINGINYYSDRRVEYNKIKNANISKGDSISIWTDGETEYIKQLVVNDNMILEYSPPYWHAWFFTLSGALFLIMSIFYLVKYSSDFFGND